MDHSYDIRYPSKSKGNDESRLLNSSGERAVTEIMAIFPAKIRAGHPKSRVKSQEYLFEHRKKHQGNERFQECLLFETTGPPMEA
jgi:hypothetical protein